MSSSHDLVLSKLCRICGSFLKSKEKLFLVKNYIKDVEECFWLCNVKNDKPEVHPSKICQKCYFSMKNIKKGHTHSQTIEVWVDHTVGDCKVCSKKRPGRGENKSKRKTLEGINQHTIGNTIIWTRKLTNDLENKVPISSASTDLNISDFDLAFNKSLPLCKCDLCQNLLVRTVMLQGCQHAFCLGCLVLKFEGKTCLLYTSPSPRDATLSRMPSSA